MRINAMAYTVNNIRNIESGSRGRRFNVHGAAMGAARGFGCDIRGNFTILLAMSAPALILLIGMGIDYWVGLSDKTRFDTAADAAALAAVNAAKAYYAANAGSQSGTALEAAAESAGMVQGAKAFAADVGSTALVSPVTPKIQISFANLSFTATLTWSGKVATHFGPIAGFSSIGIAGAAAATATLPKYLDFYVVVDTSGSMGIPTNASDQQLLIATNPDNPLEEANGYAGGCQFACHFQGYQGFAYTQSHNIPLKLNSVGASVQALLSTAAASKVIANQFRIGIYPFIVDAIQAAPLSADFTQANSVAGNLANYLDQGTSNGGMGSGGTHFENLSGDMRPYMQSAGTGMSSSSTSPFIILVTDGVDNSQVYAPSTGAWTGSQPQTPSTAFCAAAKSANYTVAVILIPYDPIVDPEPIWNNEDGAVNSLINTNTIAPAMRSCASSGYFFTASTSTDINNAMQTIFYQATQASRLTQ
jgi:Flp pilus assembly protein TadG